MFDTRLRPAKDRLLGPLAQRSRAVPPLVITLGAGVVGCGAAALASFGFSWFALGCWLVNRFLDGLDGAVARVRRSSTDFGGYLDQTLDTVVYCAIPIGVAWHQGDARTWTLCAVLIGSFAVNITSWAYLAALLEKRGRGVAATGESTSITMPTGLIEGAETVLGYSVLLALPHLAPWVFAIMTGLVTATVIQRVVWARRHLT